MKIDRGEVEALLAMLEQVHKPNNGTFAELCRTWLTVQDAPVVEVTECNQLAGTADFDYGDMLAAVATMPIGSRVRLVRVGGDW